jgi:hypothetical protein
MKDEPEKFMIVSCPLAFQLIMKEIYPDNIVSRAVAKDRSFVDNMTRAIHSARFKAAG